MRQSFEVVNETKSQGDSRVQEIGQQKMMGMAKSIDIEWKMKTAGLESQNRRDNKRMAELKAGYAYRSAYFIAPVGLLHGQWNSSFCQANVVCLRLQL